MHFVEAAVPQPPEAWCHGLKTRWDGLHVQIDALVAVTKDRMVEVVTVRGEPALQALEYLATRLGQRRVQVLDQGDDRVQLRLEVDVCPMVRLMAQTGLVPRFPVDIQRGWDRWVVVGQKAALHEAMESLRDTAPTVISGRKVQVLRSGPLVPKSSLLTHHQRKVLEVAVEMGYYDTPRATTIRQIAARMGVSKSALGETLLTLERKVIHEYVSKLDGNGNGSR